MTNLSNISISNDQEGKEILHADLQSDKSFRKEATEVKGISSLPTFPTPSHTIETIAYQFTKPSMRIRYLVHWFRIGFSIFLLLSALLSLGGCSLNAATVNWKKAVNVVSSSVVEQVILENTGLDTKISAENMLAWNASGKDGKLIIFNFNNPNVCGQLGCLYAGYWLKKSQPSTRVLLNYFNSNLPPKTQLLAIGENGNQHLPCIKVMQTDKEQIRQFNYCFNGHRYQVTYSQLFTNHNKLYK